MILFLRAWAWLRCGHVVWLCDFEGDTYYTIAKHSISGELKCRVYPLTGVTECILNNNGTIAPGSTATYITTWRYAFPKRTALQANRGEFAN